MVRESFVFAVVLSFLLNPQHNLNLIWAFGRIWECPYFPPVLHWHVTFYRRLQGIVEVNVKIVLFLWVSHASISMPIRSRFNEIRFMCFSFPPPFFPFPLPPFPYRTWMHVFSPIASVDSILIHVTFFSSGVAWRRGSGVHWRDKYEFSRNSWGNGDRL